MSATQSITVKIEINGPQHTVISSTDSGEGAHISVVTGLVMVTLYDLRAARAYTDAWTHPVDIAALLPAERGLLLPPGKGPNRIRNAMAATGPGILIEAHGSDQVHHGYDRKQRHLLIQVGTLTWIVSDTQAYESMRNAYRRVHQLAQVVLTDPR